MKKNNYEENLMVFGAQLKQLRMVNKLSQAALADMLGTHLQTISRYERACLAPNIGMLLKISETFDVSVDWLLKGTDGERTAAEAQKCPMSMSMVNAGCGLGWLPKRYMQTVMTLRI
jgi:transcriptional regulator with XRE-family HTH domain